MEKDDNRAQPISADTAPGFPGRAHAGLIRQWARISRQLVPLIGETGFGALFGRSLHVVAPRHAWLEIEISHKTSMAFLAALEQAFASVDAPAAMAANDELMSTFTRQLGALIGPGLTTRLLEETVLGDGKPKNQEEHK
jgi:hypothetical protein